MVGVSGCVGKDLSVWVLSGDWVSCGVIGGKIEEVILDGVGSFALPLAICCAHFASRRDLDFDPGGLPTERNITLSKYENTFSIWCLT